MNISEFFAMGGHGVYVWISWGAFALVLAYNLLSPRMTLRQLHRSLARQQRREALQNGDRGRNADQRRFEKKERELLGGAVSNES